MSSSAGTTGSPASTPRPRQCERSQRAPALDSPRQDLPVSLAYSDLGARFAARPLRPSAFGCPAAEKRHHGATARSLSCFARRGVPTSYCAPQCFAPSVARSGGNDPTNEETPSRVLLLWALRTARRYLNGGLSHVKEIRDVWATGRQDLTLHSCCAREAKAAFTPVARAGDAPPRAAAPVRIPLAGVSPVPILVRCAC